MGDGIYVAGLSLAAASGDTGRIGYCSSTEQSIDVSQIFGFHLAIGSRDVQAIRCLTGPTNVRSAWLGSSDDVPKTDRLAVHRRVLRLEAGFDASTFPYPPFFVSSEGSCC